MDLENEMYADLLINEGRGSLVLTKPKEPEVKPEKPKKEYELVSSDPLYETELGQTYK